MTSNSPVIKQVDHVLIQSSDPESLFNFLVDVLQLPVAWPFAAYGHFSSGGVGAGNINLESLRFAEPQGSAPPGPAENQLFGIAFQPFPLAGSLAELAGRGIPHHAPRPFEGTNAEGERVLLWTNVRLDPYLGSDPWVFLCEYNRDQDQFRLDARAKLVARQGGPLGLRSVAEIVLGVTDFDGARARWERLLAPAPETAPGRWALGEGPALRLAADSANRIRSLVLQVHSLVRARAFLAEAGLLGLDADRELGMAAKAVNGLDLRLVA